MYRIQQLGWLKSGSGRQSYGSPIRRVLVISSGSVLGMGGCRSVPTFVGQEGTRGLGNNPTIPYTHLHTPKLVSCTSWIIFQKSGHVTCAGYGSSWIIPINNFIPNIYPDHLTTWDPPGRLRTGPSGLRGGQEVCATELL